MSPTKYNEGFALPIVIAIIAVVLVGGFVFWQSQSSPSESQKGIDAMMAQKEKDAMIKKDTNETMQKDEAAIMEKNTNESMVKDDGSAMTEQKEREAAMQKKDEGTMVKMALTGYVDYTPESYADAKDKKRVLFFHATWCPTCKATNLELLSNIAKIPSDVIIFKTDYDTQKALKTKYGVTYQHTFVQVDADGNAVAKWNGGGINEIITNVK